MVLKRSLTQITAQEKIMRKLIATMAVLSILISCSQKEPNQIAQRIDRVENGLIEVTSPADLLRIDSTQLANAKTIIERMEYYKVPGVSIAVINDDRIEWTKVYGTMDVNSGAPVTTETIFEAASTSKFITSAIALHFVQSGLIDLDTNVNDYLKSWQIPDNEFTKDEKVTLRRLLTHRAGMPTTDYSTRGVGIPTLIDILNGAPPAANKPAIPEFVPGSRWQYSNVGYDVIQLLLEDVSGKPFQEIAEELVFEPLGMSNSTFVYPLDSGKKKHEAMPHDAEGISREPGMVQAALAHGGLTTTPTDLAAFTLEMIRSYQGKSETILSQTTTQQLFTIESDIDDQTKAFFPAPAFDGLGVFLVGEGKDLAFTHPGTNFPGFTSWLIGWPERGTGVVILTNGIQGHSLSMEIISAVHREYNRTDDESLVSPSPSEEK
jgi:CubicO group peptidase (beta-lactamase class C family)